MKAILFWMAPFSFAYTWAATPAEIPEPIIPAGVGVNIHFVTGHERDLDMIAAAGFRFVRMDFGWASIEREQAKYDWSGYNELTDNLEKRGLRAMYILDYSNPLYEQTATTRNPVFGGEQKDTASPQHPESIAAFARWAAAAARHMKGRHIVWEIWNEPNITFWKPEPDVKQYTDLALATCRSIRAADPQATIVGPATSEIPLKFLEDFFASGVLAYLDAVTVHPYRRYSKPPETAAEEYKQLRDLIARYAPTPDKKAMPILSGEWGYASHTKGVSLETQAAFIARQQLANLLCGVPLSIWYDWKNDGTDPNEREHNFGTVTHDLQPKPAYLAIHTLTRELARYRITQRVDVGNEQDYILLCTNAAGHEKLAAWTLGEPHAVTLRVKGDAQNQVAAVKWNGEPYAPKLTPQGLVLDLEAGPKYVTLKKVKLYTTTEVTPRVGTRPTMPCRPAALSPRLGLMTLGVAG
jgi:hypothetical protein